MTCILIQNQNLWQKVCFNLNSPNSIVIPWFDSQLSKSLMEVYKQLSEVHWETKTAAGTTERLGVAFQNTANTGPHTVFLCFLFNYGNKAPFFSDCKSRYIFGDVHLGMSCRLKNTSTNLLQQYLWSMCIALIPFCSRWWKLHLTCSSDIKYCSLSTGWELYLISHFDLRMKYSAR
jgi:hypothetical protein